MEKRAFVTGATGFVGGALAERLVADGWQVIALVRAQSDTSKLQSLGVTSVTGDVCQPEGLAEAMNAATVVFHCAALTGVGHSIADFQRVIAGGTDNLLRAAKESGVTRFVFVSSVAVYELNNTSMCEEHHPYLSSSIDPYGRAKIQAESACLAAHRSGKFEVSIVRPVFIYGPGDRRGGFLPELVGMIAKGKFRLINGGNNRIPMVYISDLTDMLVRCAERPEAAGQTYNACSRQSPTWRELAAVLRDELGLNMPGVVNARLVMPIAGMLEFLAKLKLLRTLPVSKAAVKLLSRDVAFPTDKAERELGFVSRVGFAEGVAHTLPLLRACGSFTNR